MVSLLALLPTLADEVFQIEIQPGESAPQQLVWQGQSGYSYTLWSSPDLHAWIPVDGYPRQGSGSETEYLLDPATIGATGFFRFSGESGGGPAPEGFALIPAGAFEMGD